MPTKVLIIRFSSIGDIVLTTPVIRGVKQQLGAEVHFLTKASFASVLRSNPYIDRLWTIKKEVKEIAPALTETRFDYIIDLHGNLRTLEIKTRLLLSSALHLRSRPRFYSFNKLNLRKYLLTRFGVDRLPEIHIVDRYLAAVAPLGVENDGQGLDYFIAPEDRINLKEEQLPPFYLAFVIGAAHATKRLTEGQIARFCETIGQPVVLLGGPADQAVGERIATVNANTINACGRFSLGGSADLLRQAAVVVTHDTGLMHMAAALRKPIVSVWGNTVPAFGMYPYLPGQEALERTRRREVLNLPCRPCSKIGFKACPKGHFKCITDQDPEALVSVAVSLLRDVTE